ncbi:T9SS sorting signal type C domain-containing protein [Flavobacterium sp. IMCC34852]|uniref:T9SS sorting signal type C domain-containing protein n=1 Tax=Flavobacterium rivulicola TaxID=2732161 RepID=A0A7Y3VYT8_9FLAO|nr:T9SS sorting signal type C domain-containing protein [Flavobacterium sp. IMCC34852]NNT71776.1 T9SS sorting signal type C domain-containing protein [Flavobacterium sp. IMCC34852]
MEKTLLTASGNAILLKTTSFRYLLLALTFWLGLFQQTNAQCIGPYQGFEGVPSSIATMQANGWTFAGTTNFVHNTTTTLVRSGVFSLRQPTNSTSNASVTSPLIMTPSSFSFYIRGATVATTLYSFQFSDDGGATWYNIAAGTNNVTTALNTISVTGVLPSMNTTWQEAKVTAAFPATALGYKFRVTDTRINPTNGAVCLDDFAWTSSVASENNIIVPALGNATACPVTLDVTRTYYFYDVGGDSDTSAGNQSNSIYFTPSNTAFKIKATYETFSTEATNDYLQLFTDNTYATQIPGMNFSGATIPATYTSVDANGALFYKFTTNAGLPTLPTTQTGFRIKLECVGCPAPTSLTFNPSGGISHDSAYLNFTGTASNYDIYHSTSNTAPNSGTTPTGTSATTSATVTGLSASSTYYFWVRSNCGGSTSTWIGPISATSLCTPQSVVYLENFNGLLGGVLPTCTSTDGVFQSNATNGNIYSNQVGDSFYTQGVTLTAGTLYRITYDYSTNLNGYASLDVNIGNPANNTAPTVSNISNSIAYNGFFSVINSNIVNYTPSVTGTYYLRFFVDDLEDPSVQLNLDNIRIEVETCLPPTYPGSPVSGVNDFGATLNWNAPATGAPSNGYAYFISTSNTPPNYNDAGTGTVASNSITFSTLSPNTTYYVWVRANCGAQISIWTPAFATFTTTNITTPTTIRISDLTTPYNVTCGSNITFTDSGGTGGNYANNERTGNPTYAPYSYTFVPATPGAKLMVIFNSFATENNWDGLMIYSGTSSAGTLMPSGRAAGFLPQTCPADAWSGTASPGSILSTAADGSLTFEFRSDSSVLGAGWTASIVCVSNVPTITGFTPSDNACVSGTTVVITGTNFTGITGVFFGGASATFTVNSTTQITATLPAGATTGKIRVTTNVLSVNSATDFTVLAPAPVTTGASICTGGAGTISSSTVCDGYGNAVNAISGSWTLSDPSAPRPFSSSNSTTCGFSTSSQLYTSVNFQVSVTGSYTFDFTSPLTIDAMGYITIGAFTPGSCATGTFVIGDDDSGVGLYPRMVVTLTAGVTYTLYTTFYSGSTATSFTWNITPPSGGSTLLYQNSQVQWYTAASGGTPIGSGSPFNPVGVAGSGLANTSTPGTWTYYAACSSNPTCRTAATFVIGGAVAGTASSDQNVCSGVAADLTLTGNTGSVVKWQYANDLAFTAGVTDIAASASTTLTSAQIGTFSGARYFRAVVNLAGCSDVYSNVVTITFNKAIWNGSAWSNGTGPTSTIGADFQGNYTSSVHASATSGNLSACSVTVTSGTVLFDVGTLTVQNAVVVSGGTLTFENNASLYQVVDVANAPGVVSGGNSGNVTYKRTTTGIRQFDYTYWSTPVNPQTLVNVSPNTPFDAYYLYDASVNNWAYVNPTSLMDVGKGYIIRAPFDYDINTPATYTASFNGTPNNGTLTTPIVGGAAQMNLIGNPYTSALSASAFILDPANTNLNGTLYFWTHNTPINATYQYTGSDYAIYNLVGGTSAATNTGFGGGGSNAVPLGYIASGQGFFIKGFSSGTATFKNSMRAAGNNSQFYRLSPNTANNAEAELSLEKHRYWLDITNTEGAFKQALVGYVESATNGIDRLFDGEMVDIGNAITLYTMVDNTKLSIQGKQLAFDVNEMIPLGYKSTINSTYTINLADFDGLFASQNIYLEDLVLNVIHDLKAAPYSFATESGTFDNRFRIRYTTNALGTNNPVFNQNSVVVYQNNGGLHINSGTVNMKNVTIYDVRGRELASQKQVDNTVTVFTTLPTTQQVLLVKIEGENGGTVTKKVVY